MIAVAENPQPLLVLLQKIEVLARLVAKALELGLLEMRRDDQRLMRARYSSYVTESVGFLKTSSTAAVQEQCDLDASLAWSRAAEWHGLEIIRTEKGGPKDKTGTVEFRALYTANGKFCNHHEVATFVKEKDGWKFEDSTIVLDSSQP